MAITDLTGTTWKFDCSTITIDLSEFFAIDGTLTAGGYSATSVSGGTFGLRSGWSLTFPNEGSSSPRFYCNVSSDPYLRYYAEDGTNFTVDTNCTLYISGGADATNPALIAWLSENGELQEQTKTIIKAGTYMLNSTLTAIGFWDTYFLHNIYFVDSNGTKTSLSGLIQTYMDSKYLGMYYTAGGSQYIYNFDTNTYIVDYPCGFYLPEDVDGNEDWYTWFIDNTKPVVEEYVIKAGTYRFNETLTAIPATIQLPYEFHFGDGWESYTDIYLADNVLQWRAGDGSFVNNVYNYETQTWEHDSERVIIVDTPQTVSKDFYTWFNENVPSAATTAKKFVRLYLGNVAYSSGGKCFKRLSTEIIDTIVSTDEFVFTLRDDDTYSITKYTGTKTNVVIPSLCKGKKVSRIGAAVFNNKNITSIVIPDSVTSIGTQAFNNCTKLTSVDLGKGLTRIEYGAFSNCGFSSIQIPDTVTYIGPWAINICQNLTSLVIPKSVVTLGECVVRNCTSLRTIYCEATSQPSGWDADWKSACNATVVWGYSA